MLCFRNCLLPTEGLQKLYEVHVDVEKGLIVDILLYSKDDDAKTMIRDEGFDEVFDCKGNMLAPGFIDIQLNGAYGIDFSDPNLTVEDVEKVARELPRHGVTSFCPTLVSCSKDTYQSLLVNVFREWTSGHEKNIEHATGGARVLGVHLEGPYFAPSKRGAHSLNHIVNPDELHGIHQVYGPCLESVAIVTMAPELPGASKVIEELTTKHGIVVSMGHTDATMQQGKYGMASGASLVTHLFNAMRPFHHREPGLLGLLAGHNKNAIGSSQSSQENGHKRQRTTTTTINKRPYYSLICDGLHSHPTSVQMAMSLHPKGAILVTDAMSAMGLGDGQHMLGTESVVVKGMRATLAHQPETLAGSVSSMDHCVKSFFDFTQCTPGEAIAAATNRPAHLLKLDDRIGKVQKGHKADLVLLESTTLSVLNTWINGNMVFNGKSEDIIELQ